MLGRGFLVHRRHIYSNFSHMYGKNVKYFSYRRKNCKNPLEINRIIGYNRLKNCVNQWRCALPAGKEGHKMAAMNKNGKTQTFTAYHDDNDEMKQILQTVYAALSEKGYNPVNQIVGYLLSEDPTYITNHKNARALVRHLDRDELLNALVRNYLGV